MLALVHHPQGQRLCSINVCHNGCSHQHPSHHHPPPPPEPPALLPGLWEAGSGKVTIMSREGPSSPSFCLSRQPEKPGWPASGARGSRRRSKRPVVQSSPGPTHGSCSRLGPHPHSTASPTLLTASIRSNSISGEGPS